jgi:hypothetical protein
MHSSKDNLDELIHDLNGEVFLMRGHIDLAVEKTGDHKVLRTELKILRKRTDEIQRIIQEMRKQVNALH